VKPFALDPLVHGQLDINAKQSTQITHPLFCAESINTQSEFLRQFEHYGTCRSLTACISIPVKIVFVSLSLSLSLVRFSLFSTNFCFAQVRHRNWRWMAVVKLRTNVSLSTTTIRLRFDFEGLDSLWYKQNFSVVAKVSGMLDPTDRVYWNQSPSNASLGSNNYFGKITVRR
jgi:hypothetical protein